ncbi:hypothetical protein LVJ94_52215 [Pendulispora rubella]|uniref:Cytochrome c domain-containing protein n=1 Tax=Pendulispora rubella TaxID=2741070 RepID=A0ABZ2L3V6_9BACT
MKALRALVLAAAACGPITSGTEGDKPPVDPFKELLIVDETVMTHPVFAFEHVMDRLGLEPDDTLGGAMRPLAVANRIDLSEQAAGAGEGRLVFGAADRPVTLILEFRLPGSRAEWAARWHALGAHPSFDADYMKSLSALIDDFVRPEHLAQVRLQDARSDPPVVREFHIDPSSASPRLMPAGLRRTPAHAMDGSTALRDFVSAHRQAILEDRYELPTDMLADRIELGAGPWTLPGIDEPLRHAFAAGTCDGCHGQENATLDGRFHISPYRQGPAKLSRFLFDPEHREVDELTRRAALLQSYLE